MAFSFDLKIGPGESKHKIAKFRKSILKFAQGKVLETGVGTSRNLQYYPLNCEITAVDYSPKMIEVALQKNTLSKIDYELQDVEK